MKEKEEVVIQWEDEKTSYREKLAWLCRASAELSELAIGLENGNVPDKDEMRLRLQEIELHKEDFLKEKQKLGLEDGLEFMKDHCFQGFEIKAGRVNITDPEKCEKIIVPWLTQNEDDFLYEVGMYVLFQTSPAADYRAKRAKRKKRFSFFKNLKKAIKARKEKKEDVK